MIVIFLIKLIKIKKWILLMYYLLNLVLQLDMQSNDDLANKQVEELKKS